MQKNERANVLLRIIVGFLMHWCAIITQRQHFSTERFFRFFNIFFMKTFFLLLFFQLFPRVNL